MRRTSRTHHLHTQAPEQSSKDRKCRKSPPSQHARFRIKPRHAEGRAPFVYEHLADIASDIRNKLRSRWPRSDYPNALPFQIGVLRPIYRVPLSPAEGIDSWDIQLFRHAVLASGTYQLYLSVNIWFHSPPDPGNCKTYDVASPQFNEPCFEILRLHSP